MNLLITYPDLHTCIFHKKKVLGTTLSSNFLPSKLIFFHYKYVLQLLPATIKAHFSKDVIQAKV